MTIRTIIFDAGGVIVRTENPAPRDQLAARLGMSREEINDLVFFSETARLATLGKLTAQEHWEATRKSLALPPEIFSTVPAEFFGGDVLDYSLIDYLRSLRPRFKTALLSNAWDDLRQVVVERWQVADAFDELIISAEVGLAKPDPRIYRLTIDRLGVFPHEAIFVDDVLHNLEAAREVGLNIVHFRSPQQACAEVEQMLMDTPS